MRASVGPPYEAWHSRGMTVDVGDPAPAFLLRNQNNQEVTLESFRGRKAVLLVFYPLAFTGTCQGELSTAGDFRSDTVEVLTVSVDSPYSHKVWADREGYDFPLLSDFWPHGEVARRYGVLNDEDGFALRGTFLIDRSGTVVWTEVRDIGHGRDFTAYREALASLRASSPDAVG
jgi:peroxiredoxin